MCLSHYSRGSMGNNLRWLTPDKTILVLTVPEYWAWEDMRGWLSAIGRVLDTCEQPTTVMLDFQHSTFIPKNFALHIPSLVHNVHEKADPIIFVRLSPPHRAMLSVVTRIHRHIAHKISILENVDEMLQQL